MTDQRRQKRRRLSREILGLVVLAFVIAMFLFDFLALMAALIAKTYCETRGLFLTDIQMETLDSWILSVSLLTAALFFVVLFLVLLGQKISYIGSITQGVEALRTHQMDFTMPLEGNNELTQLAEAINYLSATQRELKERERALGEEKEQLIRTLSHDIRTPLTSILAYSEYLANNEDCPARERQEQLVLIRKKAEQIRALTDILLDGGKRHLEQFKNARLLMEQLAAEFEETLEEGFQVSVDLTGCPAFSGTFDVQELRRIFDNLSSNIQKYADPAQTVTLSACKEDGQLIIRQANAVRLRQNGTESHQMGLNGIRRIAHNYAGRAEVRQDDTRFEITITLSEF